MRKIFLVMDYNCNNACISCAKKLEEKGRMGLEDITKEIDKIRPTEDDFIEISGGEPTLRPDLFDIISNIKQNYSTNIIILSNGRKFKDISFAKEIKKVGADRVMTTFYSPFEKIHDEITQAEGSFSDAFEGLNNLEGIGLPISVKSIILKQNYLHLSEFVSFAYKNFPSAWVSLHGLIMRGRAKDNYKDIVVKHTNIKPYLESALDVAIKEDKNLGVFIVPTCIIDPYYWKYIGVNWKEMSKTMIYLSPEEKVYGNMEIEQPYKCEKCYLSDNNCSWAWESAWKEYTDLFGDSELSPLEVSK